MLSSAGYLKDWIASEPTNWISLEHDLIDRERDFAFFFLRGQADLDVASALAQAGDRVAAGRCDT